MSFLCGAFAGVRGHPSSSSAGAGNGEWSRRHTISTVLTSASSPLEFGRQPGGILRAENSNTDHAGRSIVECSDSKALPTKRRRKSVTFSSVDLVTHLPTVTDLSTSAASSHRSSNSQKFLVQTRRHSMSSSPTSELPSVVRNRAGRHRASADWPRRRRKTVSGPPLSSRHSSSPPQDSDPEHASHSPLNWEENHDPSPPPKCTQHSQHQTRDRRHTILTSAANYHPKEQSLSDRHRHDWQSPSGLRHPDSFSSPGGSWYDLSSRSRARATQELAVPLQTPRQPSFCVLPSIDGGINLFGQPYSSTYDDTLPYGVYNETYGFHEHPPYIPSGQISDGDPSAQGYRFERYQPFQYSIYRATPPPVFTSPTAYFSGPPSQYHSEYPISYGSNSGCAAEYTILSLASRFSPTYAQHFRSQPECLALLDSRTASLVLSHFSPPICLVEGTGNFLISHAPNKKGLGVFAQIPLRTGEVILTEVPTLIIPSNASRVFQHSGPPLDASTVQVDMYERIFESLSKGVQKELMDLAWGGAYSDYGSDFHAYKTIMRINPLAVSLPLSSSPSCSTTNASNVNISSMHRGIFLKTSRCNHSCTPNAQWKFDPTSLTLLLTCLRPINTGDEITVTYISPYLPFFHRRAELKNLFGFDCSCDSCLRILTQFQDDIRSRLIEESDSARTFLATFWDSYPSFEAWSKYPTIYPANLLISAHKIALEMIEREGMEVLSSVQHSQQPRWFASDSVPPVPDTIRHTDGIALCYGVLSDVTNFRKWVARALDARLSHGGPGSAVADGWGAFEEVKWNGGNGKSCRDEVRFGGSHSQTGNVRKVLEKWIANPETFPAWGLRRVES